MLKLKSNFYFYLFIVSFLFNACAQTNLNKTSAEAPAETYNYSDTKLKTEKYLSTLNVGMDISLIDIEKQINSQMQGLLFEDNSMTDNNNDQFMCKVWKRDLIKTSSLDNAINFKVPLKVWLKVGYEAAPLGVKISTQKETEFDFNVNFKTTFVISNQWEIQATTTLLGYDFITKPTIKLGPIEIPVTPLVKKALDGKAPDIIKALDNSIKEKLEIKKYVLQAWNQVSQPYLLSETYNTWLKISPVGLQMTPIVIANNVIKADIGITAYTETVVGSKPIVSVASKIPNLIIMASIPQDFKVGILNEISHEEALKVAKQNILNQKFEFQNGKYAVEVIDLDIYGNEDQIIIKTGLTGSMNGTIYFKGIPYYDEKSRSMKLKNFDYDLKTKSVLVKAANWLMSSKLAKTMQESLEIPCGSNIDDIKKQIQANLSKNQVIKGVTINGTLNDLSPDQVYLTPNSIITKVMATGAVKVSVNGL